MQGPKRHTSSPRRNGPTAEEKAALAAIGAELRGLYAKVDAALQGWTCDASTDCCRFAVTGREPYPTAVELAELDRAVRARGGLPKRRSLPLARDRKGQGDRSCALLDDAGRCLVYASRPFGCRTFFCARASGPAGESADSGLPRQEITDIARAIAELSARFAPRDPGPRPLSRHAREWEERRSR